MAFGREIRGTIPLICPGPAAPGRATRERCRADGYFEYPALALGLDDLIPGVDPARLSPTASFDRRQGHRRAQSATRLTIGATPVPARRGRQPSLGVEVQQRVDRRRGWLAQAWIMGSRQSLILEIVPRLPAGAQDQRQASTMHRVAMRGPDRDAACRASVVGENFFDFLPITCRWIDSLSVSGDNVGVDHQIA
jgi:hypothetical protein